MRTQNDVNDLNAAQFRELMWPFEPDEDMKLADKHRLNTPRTHLNLLVFSNKCVQKSELIYFYDPSYVTLGTVAVFFTQFYLFC